LIFNPDVEAPWENPPQEGSIEYDVLVRENQLGVVRFTWMSRKTWAFEGLKNRLMLGEESQSQSETGSQNIQPTTTTGEHEDAMQSVYLEFMNHANLRLIFEKVNIQSNLFHLFFFLFQFF